ncbi:M14 family zinc carboxypeptidase [Geodermatophilus sp. SYSU D00814]
MSYLNVAEVETALALAARPENAAFTELTTLPYRTWEGRTCSALRIGAARAARAGVYLLGGVHAREWGSPDILINLARLLTDAYRDGTGITQGGASLGADEVRRIVTTLDVVVLPQANPDGRHHSMTRDPMWRKNRRPASPGHPRCPGGGGRGPGVDLNRNHDFLWDHTTAFSPQAPVATSADPCDEVYRGPAVASEPETANVTWLLDRYPSVTHFVDVHSFGELILYNWGDDDDQTTDPSMNFANPAWDGKRGIPDATPGGDLHQYREYLPAADWTRPSRCPASCATPSGPRTAGSTRSAAPSGSTPPRAPPTTGPSPATSPTRPTARCWVSRSSGDGSARRSRRASTPTTRT